MPPIISPLSPPNPVSSWTSLASSHLKTMMSQSRIQSRQIRPILVQVYDRANGCGAKNCRVSIPWDANPPFPWRQKSVTRCGWVGCLIATNPARTAPLSWFARTPQHGMRPPNPVESTCIRLLVWPSPQSSLATGPHFVSPRDHDVTEPDTVPPDPAHTSTSLR